MSDLVRKGDGELQGEAGAAEVSGGPRSRFADVAPEFRDALAVQAIFMAFGIPPDDIFVVYSSPQLRMRATQGAVEYVVDVATLSTGAGAFVQEWTRVAELWNGASVEERKELVEGSRARESAVHIIGGMIAKGMRPVVG